MSNVIYTYTPDAARPLCPQCGLEVEAPNNPETPFAATCANGHTKNYQLVSEEEQAELGEMPFNVRMQALTELCAWCDSISLSLKEELAELRKNKNRTYDEDNEFRNMTRTVIAAHHAKSIIPLYLQLVFDIGSGKQESVDAFVDVINAKLNWGV